MTKVSSRNERSSTFLKQLGVVILGVVAAAVTADDVVTHSELTKETDKRTFWHDADDASASIDAIFASDASRTPSELKVNLATSRLIDLTEEADAIKRTDPSDTVEIKAEAIKLESMNREVGVESKKIGFAYSKLLSLPFVRRPSGATIGVR